MDSNEQFVGTIVVNLFIGAFVYGQLTQRVKDLLNWSKKHDAELTDHGNRLLKHEGRISHLEGRRGVTQDHG